MALDSTAVTAAVDAYIDTMDPAPTAVDRAKIHEGLDPLFTGIFEGIRDNAVVSPDGSGMDLNVGGNAVTGTGKLL